MAVDAGADSLFGGSGNDVLDNDCNAAASAFCDDWFGIQGTNDTVNYPNIRPNPDLTGCENWNVNSGC